MPVTGVLIRRISPARRAAFRVLEAVAEGGYASDLLRAEGTALSSRDAGLAGQIVFGCLRFQAQLDYLIQLYSGKKATSLHGPVRNALRMAIYQLRYLERVPAHAAVHEAVELVKENRRAAAGFANAVLRKANAKRVTWPSRDIELSCPEWLLARWEVHFGAEAAQKIASAALAEPDRYVRVPPGTSLPPDVELESTEVAQAYRLKSALPAGLRLHDISSQAIIPLLDLQPGVTYLDLCAAPGNKTLQALEIPLKTAVACDLSWRRLRDVPPVCPRVVLDATQPLPFRTQFDRIFIDAPCSGTGTLARNPEIKWRIGEGDFRRFQGTQIAIVTNALILLAPRGTLLYATCSLEREENEEVVHEILGAHQDLELRNEVWRLPGRDPGDGFYAAALQWATAKKEAARPN